MIWYVAISDAGEIMAAGTAASADEASADAGGEGQVLVGSEFAGADPDIHYVKNGELRDYPARPSPWHIFDFAAEAWIIADLTEARAAALRDVLKRTSLKRAEFVTDAVGQDVSYRRKYEQALAYQAEAQPDEADYPRFQAEAARRGVSVADVAASVVAKGQAWELADNAIDEARSVASEAIAVAQALDEIEAAIAVHAMTLEAIKDD